mgnify:CR=1 FL=1
MNKKRGFSLIEILVVIGLIVALMAALVPTIINVRRRAATSTTKSTLREVETSIEAFYNDTGAYPQSLDDLLKRPSEERAKNWSGPYLGTKTYPVDGWKRKIEYKFLGDSNPDGQQFEVYSRGEDGKGHITA